MLSNAKAICRLCYTEPSKDFTNDLKDLRLCSHGQFLFLLYLHFKLSTSIILRKSYRKVLLQSRYYLYAAPNNIFNQKEKHPYNEINKIGDSRYLPIVVPLPAFACKIPTSTG